MYSNKKILSGAITSVYNKNLISFKNKLKQLPSFVEKRKKEILQTKEQLLEKIAAKDRELKDSLEKKRRARKTDIDGQIKSEVAASEKTLKETLATVSKAAGTQADLVYQARQETLSGEGEFVLQRYRQGIEFITSLKKLWTSDKKKKLKRLDISELNLASGKITVRGIAPESNSKNSNTGAAKREASFVKNGKAGKTKAKYSLSKGSASGGIGLNRPHPKKSKPDLVARVSWFNDSITASGVSASNRPGVALNMKPGTHSGWNNKRADKWMRAAGKGKPYYARIVIKGKTITVPIIDKGPHESTGRGIDITLVAAQRMGWSASNFPTDAVGKMWLIGQKKR